MRVQNIDFLLKDIVNGHDNVGPEGLRESEAVAVIEENRISSQRRGVWHQARYNHHVGGVLHHNPGIAMIWMIVVRPRCNHNVGFPLTDLADDLFADLKCWQKLSIVVVEDLVFDSDAPTCFQCFSPTALCEFLPVLRLMPDITVRERYELHLVAQCRILSGNSPGAEIAIIRVGAKGDDANGLIL